MPHLTIQIDPAGPIISLLVGISEPRMQAMTAAGIAIPQAVVARFLVDTGASCTCIDQDIVTALQLTPTGQADVHTPSTGKTPAKAFVYDVSLMLYHTINTRFFTTLAVMASDFSQQNIQGLLGRDVLDQCLMVYDGSAGAFSLAF